MRTGNRNVVGSTDAASMSVEELPQWDLRHLYPACDSSEFLADLDAAAERTRAFAESNEGQLAEIVETGGGDALAAVIRAYEEIEDLLGRLMSYASLVYAGDTSDPANGKFYADTLDKVTSANSNLVFFTLELNRLEDEVLESAANGTSLARYRPWLSDLRAMRPYELPDEQEKLLQEKAVTGRSAWNRLFDETMSGLRFDADGESLTTEQALHRLQDTDPETRRKAAEALTEGFEGNGRTFGLILNTLMKDKEIEDRWRGFERPAYARHVSNRVEPEVVDALSSAVRESYPQLSHRYYQLKAGWLGKEQLEHWDRNAPLPFAPDRKVGWAEARDCVLDAYAGFTPEMAAIGERFFDEHWIDAATRPGKAPGAFSHPTVPSAHPYVLLNFQGKVRDVMTLAHELGHGVHQVLAGQQGALMAPTPLTLAETASVFGEMLTFRRLLDGASGPAERKAVLAQKVEDMLNTVVRQIAFYTFEERLHDERRNGELSVETIGEIWLDVQRDSLGPAIRLAPDYASWWCYIPHFVHTPFYVYAYAFGDCLVNSLFAVYEEADEGFVEKYFDMLRAGGTKRHGELLAPFGLDAGNPDFWQKGLGVIGGMIDELEEL